MEQFCTITPTRGDRPELLDHCKYQLSRMHCQPAESYFISYLPFGDYPDLVQRMRVGIETAEKDGFDIVAVIEDDDLYMPQYFNTPILTFRQNPETKFVGDTSTHYYNVKNLTMQKFNHPRRSSLFKTFFRISALKAFNWDAVQGTQLDIALWQYARNIGAKTSFQDLDAIGIKHGVGKSGGKFHNKIMPMADPDMTWLRKQFAPYQSGEFMFYKQLHEKLNA